MTDLRAGLRSSTTVRLAWTATGNDGTTGRAASYELRWAAGSSCPITLATFGVAAVIGSAPAPAAAGSTETLDVVLADTAGTCFAIRVLDGVPNRSALSNVAWPPARVDDLAATAPADDRAQPSWTAVGANDHTGTADQYVVFHVGATGACPADPLFVTSSPSAVQETLAQAPQAVTTTEAALVTGLDPGTAYCVVVQVVNAAGSSSLSNVASVTTPDTTPPDPPAALSLVTAFPRSLDLQFNSSGDSHLLGAASTYELRYATGAACGTTFTWADAGNTVVAVPVAAPLPPAGTPIAYTLAPLSPDTHVCIAVSAADALGNVSAPSSTLEADTLVDSSPPAALVLGAVQALDATSTTVVLRWTAVADDGTDAATGRVTAYDVRWTTVASGITDCTAFGTTDFAAATSFASQPMPLAVVGGTEVVTVTFTGGATDQPACVAVAAVDAAGNMSTASNWVYVHDNTPPAPPSNLAEWGSPGLHGTTLSFTAVGDDGTSGTASAYDARVAPGTCAGFDFAAATTLPTTLPQAAGSAEMLVVSGLDYATTYCVGIVVLDAMGNASSLVTVTFTTATPSSPMQVQAVVAQLVAASSTPTALTGEIDAVVVTYVKEAVGGAALGTGDGAGFFVQAPSTTDAIFVALDPATFSTGVAVGDIVDVFPSTGTWVACAAPCSAANGLPAITDATGTIRSSGAPLPATFNGTTLTVATWPLPPSVPWTRASARVGATGIFATVFTSAGDGFSRASVTTTGVSTMNANFKLRIPDGLAASLAVVPGLGFIVLGTPMWRTDTEANLAAWVAADLKVSPVVRATVPADGAYEVPVSTTVVLRFSEPLDGATVTAQASPGACTGRVQVSGDDFTTCIGLSFVLDALGKELTLTPSAPLAVGKRYKIRTTAGLLSPDGLRVPAYTAVLGFVTDAPCTATRVVISQVYGGGGNSGATYKNDFIELHNRGTTVANVTGWSVQYASDTGGTWSVTPLAPVTTIPPGGYVLVREAAGAGGTTDLPTPEVLGSIPMGGTAGKVALVSNTTALTGTCPAVGGAVMDLVAYGATACTVETAAASNTTSVQRGNAACQDTANNDTDFVVTPPAPRNGAAPTNLCTCGGPGVVPASADGSIGAGEYGVHVDGQNRYVNASSSVDWYATWTADTLYVGVTGGLASEGLVLYVGAGAVPAASGTAADGSTAMHPYDGTGSTLPFRGTFVAYVKNTYNEHRPFDGSNGWGAATAGGITQSFAGTTREFAIPWTTIRGAGRPGSFALLGYLTSSSGFVYGAAPSGPVGFSAVYTSYFEVADSTPGHLPFVLVRP